jgi:hypothetical protein
MRDNYVGDVGDYYKYGLLRALCGDTLKLGVAWYLYTDPCNSADGHHLRYLTVQKREQYRSCDPELYDKLGQLVEENARSVAEVHKRDILPPDTAFHGEVLSLSHLAKGSAATAQKRLDYRAQWLKDALDATAGVDIVFFDPDNGLQVESVPKHHDKGPKFTFYDELLPFWQRGQSLVIYQHKNRQRTAQAQIQNRLDELQHHLGQAAFSTAVYFPACSGRFFLILGQEKHRNALEKRCQQFRHIWREHWK